MYLKCSTRCKNGKEHRSWSNVESRRVPGGCVQRHVLYLGEINDSQRAAWQKSIEVFEEGQNEPRQVALFPEDRLGSPGEVPQIQLKLHELSLHRPRQWGACWLALELWRELGLDEFWRAQLPESRKGTRWDWRRGSFRGSWFPRAFRRWAPRRFRRCAGRELARRGQVLLFAISRCRTSDGPSIAPATRMKFAGPQVR